MSSGRTSTGSTLLEEFDAIHPVSHGEDAQWDELTSSYYKSIHGEKEWAKLSSAQRSEQRQLLRRYELVHILANGPRAGTSRPLLKTQDAKHWHTAAAALAETFLTAGVLPRMGAKKRLLTLDDHVSMLCHYKAVHDIVVGTDGIGDTPINAEVVKTWKSKLPDLYDAFHGQGAWGKLKDKERPAMLDEEVRMFLHYKTVHDIVVGTDGKGDTPFNAEVVNTWKSNLPDLYDAFHGQGAWKSLKENERPAMLDEEVRMFGLYETIYGTEGASRSENSRLSNLAAWKKSAAASYDDLHGKGAWSKLDPSKQNEAVRLMRYYGKVHKLAAGNGGGQAALCLSGGGIRSAAFGLGILQGLARHNLLSQFHYLSTVSGGGYIGAWLTAWASRPKAGSFGAVEEQLKQPCAPRVLDELRSRQTYLTPLAGIGSPDAWAALAHVVRNLLLNWLVFLPLIAALLLAPRLGEALLIWWTEVAEYRQAYLGIDLTPSLLTIVKIISFQESFSAILTLGKQSWLDSVAVVLVAVGVGISMTNRAYDYGEGNSGQGIKSKLLIENDREFVMCVMAPVLTGAFVLLMATCGWLKFYSPDAVMIGQWIFICAIVFPGIRLIVHFLEDRARAEQSRNVFGKELAAQFVSGAVVGMVISAGIAAHHHVYSGMGAEGLRAAAAFGLPWFMAAFLIGQIVLSGLTSRLFHKTGDRNREWLARASGLYGAAAIGWLFLFSATLYGWETITGNATALTSLTLGSGILSLAGGVSPATKVTASAVAERLRVSTIVSFLSLVFIVCFAIWIAHATETIMNMVLPWPGASPAAAPVTNLPSPSDAMRHFLFTLAAILLLVGFSALASYFVNVNYFSLNALYRNRLVRAFLGSSNIKAVTGSEPKLNPFDRFAEDDNVPMNNLWDPSAPKPVGPFPVINMTLNLTAVENDAWQERKAASFVTTPLHTGGDLVDYRPSSEYAGGITLGTAISISGAAASPNWGYHSSSITSFLMTMFNLRLGSWLGNPRSATAWSKAGPKFGWSLFWQEALGHTSSSDDYVYLSDGGHFENLGLYEMIRRRCHVIVVSDAGADPNCTLEDLGNAVRKIAIDFNVKIIFDRIDVSKRGKDPANPGVYCATGRIVYPEEGSPEGMLVYIKPGLYDDVPADIRAYAAANAAFPHDSTLNQWFTESQFESYRALGSHAIRMITSKRDEKSGNIIAEPKDITLTDFARSAEDYLRGYANKTEQPQRIRLVS